MSSVWTAFTPRSWRAQAAREPGSGRIWLLDPDLRSIGHHRRYSEGLKKAFESLGHSVGLYGALRCPRHYAARVGVNRAFSTSLYARRDRQALPIRWLDSNAKLAVELAGALRDMRADDTILVHTTGGNHVLGYYAWYLTIPEPRPRICLQLMFPPNFGGAEADRAAAVELMESSLRPWLNQDEKKVMLAVDNRRLGEDLHQLSGRNFPVLPMPIWAGPPPVRSGRRKDRPVLFLPGDLRREKGKGLIKSVMPELQSTNFSLLVQSTKRQKWHRRRGLDVAALPPDYLHYLQLMMDADAVLLPYDPQAYAHRSSAAFIEALGCGKPVLVSAGTAMADELERLGAVGIIMREQTSRALLDGMHELVRRLEELTPQAERLAPEIRARHSASAFASELLGWAARGGGLAQTAPPGRAP
jgi:hypothetical protein